MIDIHPSISEAIGPLIEYMEQRGFRTTKADYYEEAFGDAIVDFRKGDELVEVIRDRLRWYMGYDMSEEQLQRVGLDVEFDDPTAFCDVVIAWMERRQNESS